jgi:F0F1-type ATP synthase epsilon subunit
MKTFKLIIRTPDRELFNDSIVSVSLDTEQGRIQVLPGHADLMTTLEFSRMRVDMEGRSIQFVARSGIFSFDHSKNSAELLALYCEEESEVNLQNAAEYLEFLRTELAKGDLSDYQVLYLQGEKIAVEKQVKAKASSI